jgi:uncharacterized protein YktB (UPF0637 family)
MSGNAIETIKTLTQVEEAAAFTGFTEEDFDIFSIDGFAERMANIRQRIKPKLIQLGQVLPERLSAAMDEPLYPHIAQHLRRTVNPPVHTWVAFARSPRAYKPFVHLRVAINREHLVLLAFVEDYADEKATFAANLERNAEPLAAYLAHHAVIHSFDLTDADGKPLSGHALDAGTLTGFARRMNRVKGQHARFGIPFAPTHPILQNGPELVDAIVEDLHKLKPLYDCGKPDFQFTYTPKVIASLQPTQKP